MYVLRTDTHNNGLSVISAVDNSFCFGSRQFHVVFTNSKSNVVSVNFYFCIQEVHLRRSDESCNEQVARCVVQVLRGIYLLNNSVFHNNDSGTKCHSLGLVMCYVDDGSAQSLMQFRNLGTHLYTKLCIQV